MKKKIGRLLILNTSICAVDIVVFSQALLAVKIVGGTPLEAAAGITAALMSGLSFFIGNYLILAGQGPKRLEIKRNIETLADCRDAVVAFQSSQTFSQYFSDLLSQIDRVQRKVSSIDKILLKRFSETELTYSKFRGAILQVERLFLQNTKSLLVRVNGFDEDEYGFTLKSRTSGRFSLKLLDDKMQIYNDCIAYVHNGIENNEELILKLDRVLSEISKLDTMEVGEVDDSPVMKEIDDLIRDTRLYKQ